MGYLTSLTECLRSFYSNNYCYAPGMSGLHFPGLIFIGGGGGGHFLKHWQRGEIETLVSNIRDTYANSIKISSK